jgi:phage terminase small subunit
LNTRQAAFVREYLIDRNATQAAIRSGYSAATASSLGERLLRNVDVAAAVDAGLAKQAARLQITADQVQTARRRLAFADPRKLFDEHGRPLSPNLLDDDVAQAVTGIDLNDDGSVKRYRLEAKAPHLAALSKHFGLDERRIKFALPVVDAATGCTEAQAAIVDAVAGGDLLPSEGAALSGLVESQRKALETSLLEQRLKAIEERLGK